MAKASLRSETAPASQPMLKYIALGLFCLGLFFVILFYVYDSSQNSNDGGDHTSTFYKYLLTLVALTIAAIILLIYRHTSRFVKMLEHGVIVAIVVISALSINQLNKGYTDLFAAATNDQDRATLFIYASLVVGFIGTGGLMAMLRNFYMR